MATIFLDMDGVVADFDGYAEPIVGFRTPGGVRYDQEGWEKISANPRVYRDLQEMPEADRLVKEVNPKLMSSQTIKKQTTWVEADGNIVTREYEDTYELYQVSAEVWGEGLSTNQWQRPRNNYYINLISY